jgi:hypothetical protein
MFSIKREYLMLQNGNFKISVFKNLQLSEEKKAYITEELSKAVITDDFKLTFYFDSETFIKITKTHLRFYGYGNNVLHVETSFEVNDSDIRNILEYIIDETEYDSDDEEKEHKNDGVTETDINNTIGMQDTENTQDTQDKNENMTDLEKILYGRITA